MNSDYQQHPQLPVDIWMTCDHVKYILPMTADLHCCSPPSSMEISEYSLVGAEFEGGRSQMVVGQASQIKF